MRVSLDNIDLTGIEIVEKAVDHPSAQSMTKHVGIVFHDVDKSTVTLWSTGDLRVLMLRALHRLEAFYSTGASGMPKNEKR